MSVTPFKRTPVPRSSRSSPSAAGHDFSRFEITCGSGGDLSFTLDTVRRFADVGVHRFMVFGPGFVLRSRFETDLYPQMERFADAVIAKVWDLSARVTRPRDRAERAAPAAVAARVPRILPQRPNAPVARQGPICHTSRVRTDFAMRYGRLISSRRRPAPSIRLAGRRLNGADGILARHNQTEQFERMVSEVLPFVSAG